MFYILVFVGIAVLLVVVVLVRNGRDRGGGETPKPHGTAGASRTNSRAARSVTSGNDAVPSPPTTGASGTTELRRRLSQERRGRASAPGALPLAGVLAPSDPEHRVVIRTVERDHRPALELGDEPGCGPCVGTGTETNVGTFASTRATFGTAERQASTSAAGGVKKLSGAASGRHAAGLNATQHIATNSP